MKKTIFLLAAILVMGTTFTSCVEEDSDEILPLIEEPMGEDEDDEDNAPPL